MDDLQTNGAEVPRLAVEPSTMGRVVTLSGAWTLRAIAAAPGSTNAALERAATPDAAWDLRNVTRLDTTGALLLWRTWERRLPQECRLTSEQRRLFGYWQRQDEGAAAPARIAAPRLERAVAALAAPTRASVDLAAHSLRLTGELALDTAAVLRRPLAAPWRELSATMHLAGSKALPITGLVGIMVGVVVAHLSALQLKTFGADQLIVDMLGYAVIRELGPLIAAIIVAGRSGAAMTAQIGAMRLAQELDALTALGLSISRRLLWPRVAALVVVTPLIVLWTILTALAGGILASYLTLGLGLDFFLAEMPERVPLTNLWIGLGKGLAFGAAIGFTAAYLGPRIKPNTRALGAGTTTAVVAAITAVILIDAAFAIMLAEVGL